MEKLLAGLCTGVEEEAIMNTKIKKCCPNCSQLYQLKAPTPKSIPNIPLFLACGHSMCENCIRNLLKTKLIQCKACLEDMRVSNSDTALLMQNKMSLYKLFPVNLYMAGELTMQELEPKGGREGAADNGYYIDTMSIVKNEVTPSECQECRGPTTKMCQQCCIILCNNCFNKTHKSFIIFKNHSLQNIELAQQKYTCKIHKDKPLDYYCKDCKKSICMDCLMIGGEKSCKKHDVTSKQEVNETFLFEIAELTPKVEETLKRLTKTAVEVGDLLTKLDDDRSSSEYTTLFNSVDQHSSKIIAIIQKQKDEITNKLLVLKNSENKSLQDVKSHVAEAIKEAKSILNTITSLDSSTMMKLNLSVLLEDVKRIIDTPWYLNRDESEQKINVSAKEDLYSLLSEYIKLEGDAHTKYRLCNTTELTGNNVEIPPAPTSIVYPPEPVKDVDVWRLRCVAEQKPKENAKPHTFIGDPPTRYRRNTVSCNSLNSTNSETSLKPYLTYEHNRPRVKTPENEHPKLLSEGSREVIYVSHIVDPHNLYVQRASHQHEVQELLREFRNAVSLPKPAASLVTEGKMYLVHNKADNLWQRGRVVAVDRSDADRPLFHVFCIDFGSSGVVSVDKLRLLSPARIISPPPFAISCCLANCEPIRGSWRSDDSVLLQNIIDNRRAVMYVRQVRCTGSGAATLECDIATFDDGVNLAQALAFHGRARIPQGVSYPQLSTLAVKPTLYFGNYDYKPNSVEEVYIAHVKNPDNFFVRKRHHQIAFEKLCEELAQEYSMDESSDRIYLPEKGMVCAVNVERGALGAGRAGAWARGVVLELPGRGRALVLLADVGARVLVRCSALRRIQKQFTVAKALATECHLAGVTPPSKKWSPKAVVLLQSFTDRLLQLYVEENEDTGSLGVTLYDKSDEENIICINTEMIKHKYAYPFGIYTFNKNADTEYMAYDKSPLDEPKPRREQTREDEPKPKEDDLKAIDKGPLRIEAKVLSYQSPSLIYVSPVLHQRVFRELFENIQKYFSQNTTQGKAEWKVGERCCCVCAQAQAWRRAAILAVDGDRARVFHSDCACVEEAPLAGLREMPPQFAALGDAAIACHLAGVVPASGDKWPSLTTEYLKQMLDVYGRVFITELARTDRDKDNSMPVELWVYHVEPNVSEWRCLNRRVVEQGLGVPLESYWFAAPGSKGDDMLSFLDITGSVRDRLQLEPVPMKPLTAPPEPTSDRSRPSTPVAAHKQEPTSAWMPPAPLPSDEFAARPTHIDKDGVIYLHAVSQQDTLHSLREALDARAKELEPEPAAELVRWAAGDPCVALCRLDDRLYRGRVLEVDERTSTCLVHYIDRGNEELCSFENLRKSSDLHQIPTQAHKCVLSGIRPIGENWDKQTLDYIHKIIVEKHCYVKVTGEPIGDVTPIDLRYDKLWISEHLVDFELAVFTDGKKDVVRKFAPTAKESIELEETFEPESGPGHVAEADVASVRLMSDADSDSSKSDSDSEVVKEEERQPIIGTFATFPSFLETEFLCTIDLLNEMNIFELSVVKDNETGELYKQMQARLQSQSFETALNGVYEHKACLALYPADGQWYRASILQYSDAKKLIKVKYVDYGNIEVIALNDVREISDEFLELPPATVTATLHGVQFNAALDYMAEAQKIAATFLDKDPFHAKVIERDVIPSVELRDVDGKLIYDNLIRENIFICCHEESSS